MDEVVTLETYWSLEEAQLNKNLLEAEGIPCFLQGEATSATLFHLANATGGVRLQVRKSDLQRASSVLQEVRQEASNCEPPRGVVSSELSDHLPDSEIVDASGIEFDSVSDSDDIAPDENEDENDLDHAGLFAKLRSFRAVILMPFLIGPILGAILLAFYLLSRLASLFE